MMCMVDLVAINVSTPKINSWCCLEKEFTELIYMNPWILLYFTGNQVDSCYGCIHDPLILDTKDILCINDDVLFITYESLAMGSLKRHILAMT